MYHYCYFLFLCFVIALVVFDTSHPETKATVVTLRIGGASEILKTIQTIASVSSQQQESGTQTIEFVSNQQESDKKKDHHNTNDNDSIITIETGTPFVVWDTQDTKCNNYQKPLDLPDVPARAFVDNHNITHLITADTTTWISYGSSILNVTRNCTIAYNATFDPNPQNYAADEFIDATYSFGNGTVIGLLHTEYPGINFQNCHAKPKPSYPKCWMVSIGMAISNDWGYTWRHIHSPPHHLVATVPYPYDPTGTNLAFGWGDTSGIVRHPKNGYYYVAMLNRNRIGKQSNGTCVMRTKTLLEPSSWRGWNGTDFSISFINPYDNTANDNGVVHEAKRRKSENSTRSQGTSTNYNKNSDDDGDTNHICTVLEGLPSNCNMLGVTYSTYLDQFVGSLWCPFTTRGNVSPRHEFLFTTSDDMIHWSPAQLMFDPYHQDDDNSHLQNAAYPTLMDATAPHPPRNDMNFESIGQQATLFYVQITHNFFKEGRQLMGVNVTFHKKKKASPLKHTQTTTEKSR